MRARLVLLACLTLALASCSVPGSGAGASTRTITFGATIPVTGDREGEGAATLDGYQFAVSAINHQGGIPIGGRHYDVHLVYYDDQSQPARTARLYRKLVVEDRVDFLLGPYSSTLTVAADSVAERYHIPLVGAQGTADSIYSTKKHWQFSIGSPAGNYLRGIIATVLARDPHARTLALLAADDPFSRDVMAGAAAYARDRGMMVISQQIYSAQAISVSPQLAAVRAVHPDLLLVAGHLQDAILIIRQARQLCLSPKAIGVSIGPTFPEFATTLGAAGNYVFGASQWTSALKYRGDDQWETPLAFAAAFRGSYRAYRQEVPYQAAGAAATVMAYQRALTAAGTLNRTRVRDALAHLDINTFYGRIKFDARGVNVYKPMAAVQQQPNGKTYTVFPPDVAQRAPLYPMPPSCGH